MKRVLIAQLVVLVMMTAGIGCAQDPAAKQAAVDATEEVVATYSGGKITAGELEGIAGAAIVKLKQQMFDAKVGSLEQEIFKRLVAAEAGKAGISEDEYMKQNIKVEAPGEEEIARVMTQYRSRLPKEDAEARKQVVEFLSQKARQGAGLAFQGQLFDKAGVKINLEPPRVKATVQPFNSARGPAEAPITIWEYTDFQCPYCVRAQETIHAVMEHYGDSVRHVFKNLPLQMHPQAHGAAQAAICANDQGKFWEMHDWMFANSKNLDRETVVAQAKEMGFDEAAFATCLDEQTHSGHVDQDMKEAQSFGITGTPGFVINGRIITGAQPLEAFVKIVDDELERLGLPIPEAPAEKAPQVKVRTQQVPPENAK